MKLNLILIVVYLPLLWFLLCFFVTSFAPIRALTTLELVLMILSFLFAFLVSYFHPRCKHWRKAMGEFEDNYRYEKEAE